MITLSGSNYPCLERISMVPKMFEPLRIDCIFNVKPWEYNNNSSNNNSNNNNNNNNNDNKNIGETDGCSPNMQ